MSGPRVLLVESDQAFAENVLEMLAHATLTADHAATAAAARRLADAALYDVAVIDTGLPDARGVELVAELKKRAPHLLAVLVSGQPTLHSARDAIRAGAAEFLAKDGDPRELEATLRRAAQRAGLARALRESEARYAVLVEKAPLGIALVQDGRYALANERYAEIYAFPSARSLVGLPLEDVYAEPERARVRERWRLDDDAWPDSYVVTDARRQDGARIDVAVTRARLELDGRLAVQLVVRDITEENRLARELDEARAQVEEKRRLAALGEMVAGIAHEIRNPLQSVAWGVKDLRALVVGKGDEAADALAKIDRGIHDTNAIVSQVLDFARPMKLARFRFPLADLLESTREDMAPVATKASVGFSVSRGDGLDEAFIDAQKLKQALVNLATNAIEASPSGATVTLRASRGSGGAVVFDIDDEGSGIPPELAEKIYLPFVTTKVKGTGLGLAIVRRIAEAHGGTIRLEPRQPRGTRARLEIPPTRG